MTKFINFQTRHCVRQIFLIYPAVGFAVGLFIGVNIFLANSFSEPAAVPAIDEPTATASTSALYTSLGITNSAGTGTDTVFNFLRTIYTNIGGTPSSQTGYTTNKGRISDLIGTSTPTVADGKNVFNYLKLVNDNLDFPETSSVLSSDTVKNISGSISNCSSNGGNTCYAATGKWASADCTNGTNACYANSGKWASADCTNGVNACYANSGYWASALCASAGSQSCWPTGTYYSATACAGTTGQQTCYAGASGEWHDDECADSTTATKTECFVDDTAKYITATACSAASANGSCFVNTSTMAGTDADLVAGNIKSGVTIFGVAGSYVKKSNGEACTAGIECTSTNCVDSVCCNSTCTATCNACNVTGSVGTCTNIPSGTNPDSDCTGAYSCSGFTTRLRNMCNGAGACADIDSAASDCSGICSNYCSSGSCVNTDTFDSGCTVATNARSTSGDGYCSSGTCTVNKLINSASGQSCTTKCTAIGKSCIDVGSNTAADDNTYWTHGLGCYPCGGATCSSVMNDQSITDGYYPSQWTHCLCQ